MNQNLKDDILTKKSYGWFALIAILALGISAAVYNPVYQKISAGERDLVMVDRLNEIAHLHVLLAHISSGHTDEAKSELKIRLADEIAAVNPMVASASPAANDYGRRVLAMIDRQQKAHPDYYLTSSTSAGPDKIKLVQFDKQVVASKPVSQ